MDGERKRSGSHDEGSAKRPKPAPAPAAAPVQVEQRRPLARGDACNACRSRKVRCTGERPTCSNCTKRTRPCVYSEKRYMLTVLDDAKPMTTPMDYFPMMPQPQVPIGSAAATGQPSMAPSMPSSIPTGSSEGTLSLPLAGTPRSLLSASPGAVPLLSPQGTTPFSSDMFQFPSFLPVLGSSPTGLSGQTLPPEYAGLDLDALIRELQQDIAEAQQASQQVPAAAPPPAPHVNPAELTALEKEHFIWLYFSHQRLFCLEMHFATFWSRLQSDDPKEQPHPCLLNAIYLVTCWASSSQTLRDRAVSFYKEAYDHLRDAMAQCDRLLDAARAGFLMTCYLYSMTRFCEAATMAGMTFSIAIMCGLHLIPSSRFIPGQTCLPCRRLRRHPIMYLEQPKSQIEVAERIYTFWSVFMLDRCAQVSQEWPPGFGVDWVCTPLPRPWSEYETPGDHLDHDETLFDLMQCRRPAKEPTELGQVLKAIEILFRCSQPGVNMVSHAPSAAGYDAIWGNGERAQREKAMLEQVLETYTEQLPAKLKSVQKTTEGKSITNMTGTLQFMLGGAQMFLHDTNAFDDPNELALAAVRRMLGVIYLLGDEETSFDSGLLVVMVWSKMGRLLIRESLRLEKLGDTFGSAKVDAEFNTVIRALKERGTQFVLAKMQADDLEMYRREAYSCHPGGHAAEDTEYLGCVLPRAPGGPEMPQVGEL